MSYPACISFVSSNLKKSSGFTLIEMIIVVVILAVLAAVAAPKFIDLSKSADKSIMKAQLAAFITATDQVTIQTRLHPENYLGINKRRFIWTNSPGIRMRGGYPDGNWNTTFQYLVDFSDTQIGGDNNCDGDEYEWCIRQKGVSWFTRNSRQLIDADISTGRGFVLAPQGYNVNQTKCYVYYFNPNTNPPTDSSIKPIISIEDSEC